MSVGFDIKRMAKPSFARLDASFGFT